MLHPVTTEMDSFREKVDVMVDVINNSQKNYVVIYPNNDLGSSKILKSYESFKGNSKVVVFPSMRFEYFLIMLKHADFIMGNSSAGVREAHYYNVPCINIEVDKISEELNQDQLLIVILMQIKLIEQLAKLHQ